MEKLSWRSTIKEIVDAGLGNNESWIKRDRSIFKKVYDLDNCSSFLAKNLVFNRENGPNLGNETAGAVTFAGNGVSHEENTEFFR